MNRRRSLDFQPFLRVDRSMYLSIEDHFSSLHITLHPAALRHDYLVLGRYRAEDGARHAHNRGAVHAAKHSHIGADHRCVEGSLMLFLSVDEA